MLTHCISHGALFGYLIRTPNACSFSSFEGKSLKAKSQVIVPFSTLVPMMILKMQHVPNVFICKGTMSHIIMWLWVTSWDHTWDVLTARSQTQEKIGGGKWIYREAVCSSPLHLGRNFLRHGISKTTGYFRTGDLPGGETTGRSKGKWSPPSYREKP